MATSGTVGNTAINTGRFIEKALRRCGLTPQVITPEIVDTSRESLFMLLMGLSSRGLNLWCIDHKLMPLVDDQATYVLPAGTLDVLNLLHCSPIRLEYAEDYQATYAQSSFTEPTRVTRYGVKFTSLPTTSFEFQSSSDGLAWVTHQTITELPDVDIYGWYDVDPQITNTYFRVYSLSLGTVEDLFLSNTISEIVVTPFNRDDYASQPNKSFRSLTATNYWFEKRLNPRITLWPVPSDDTRHLSLFRYRQIQDIGSLTEEVEIPTRWLEAVSWHLAARLAFEIPGVDSERRKEVVQLAGTMTIEAEGGETDGSPTYLAPNIGCYTR